MGEAASGGTRFDGDSARWILERAAAAEQRRKNALYGSYGLEELEQMAAEAGISAEALHAAVAAHAERARGAGNRRRTAARPRAHSRSGLVLAAAGGIGCLALLVAVPAFGQAVLWALVAFLAVVALLAALGAAPF